MPTRKEALVTNVMENDVGRGRSSSSYIRKWAFHQKPLRDAQIPLDEIACLLRDGAPYEKEKAWHASAIKQ